MATTGLYDKSLKAIGGADIDLINHRLVAVLIDLSQGYAVDLAADEFLTDLPADSVVASVPLTGKSVGDKCAFDADDTTFPDITSGLVVGAAFIYRDTGFDNSSPLIYYTDNAAGLPVTGDGDDVVFRWPTPIFKLKA